MKNKIFVFLSLTLVLSCHKPQQDNLLNMSDYPVRVGDQWTYLVTNITTSQIDTALILVTATAVINNDSIVYQTQTSVQGIVVDSGVITMSSTSYKYVPTNDFNSLFGQIELTFPINAQSTWVGTQGSDEYNVIASNQTISVMGNTYTNVVEVRRNVIDPQYYNIVDTMFICPQIGIINFNYDIIFEQGKTLQLMSYKLN